MTKPRKWSTVVTIQEVKNGYALEPEEKSGQGVIHLSNFPKGADVRAGQKWKVTTLERRIIQMELVS